MGRSNKRQKRKKQPTRRLCKPGESKLFYVKCRDAEGNICRHKMKIAADGHVMLLDHPRGEPGKTLCYYRLAGIAPCGCYSVLSQLQSRGKQLYRDAGWEESNWSFSGAAKGGIWPSQAKGTSNFLEGLTRAGSACSAAKAVLRTGGCFAQHVREHRKKPVWVLSQDVERVRTIVLCGEPAWFSIWSRSERYVARAGGFIKACCSRGAILWDATLPGVAAMVVEGMESTSPGGSMLLRLTERLLDGWLGVLRGPTQGRATSTSSPASPGPPPSGPCPASP